MSKKIVVLLVIAAIIALIAVPAFADTSQNDQSWFTSMISAKKAWVDQAVSDGRLTAEQGETWKNHFDQMYEFHQQNGFVCPMGGLGAGRGQGLGMGRGSGFGRGGGMGGWGFNQAPAQQ